MLQRTNSAGIDHTLCMLLTNAIMSAAVGIGQYHTVNSNHFQTLSICLYVYMHNTVWMDFRLFYTVNQNECVIVKLCMQHRIMYTLTFIQITAFSDQKET